MKPLDPLRAVVKAQLERAARERTYFRNKFLESKPGSIDDGLAYFNLAIATGCWTAAKAMQDELRRLEKTHPDL